MNHFPTRGPWKVVHESPNDECTFASVQAKGEDGKWLEIAVLRGEEPYAASKGVANARLIAAAPDLLSAARRALNVLRTQGESVRPGNVLGSLQAALTKAKGGAS